MKLTRNNFESELFKNHLTDTNKNYDKINVAHPETTTKPSLAIFERWLDIEEL